eukprot:scaffold569_cov127-Cylindrotheca_fusiformis.AAC.1
MFVGMLMCQAVTQAKVNEQTDEVESFLMDSGASCHVVADDRCLVNIKKSDDKVVIGDKSEMKSVAEGVLYLETKDGVKLRLNNVKVVPGIAKSIISMGLLVDAGNKLEVDRDSMLLRNPFGNKILLEKRDSPLYYLEAKRMTPKFEANVANDDSNVKTVKGNDPKD